MPEPRVSLAEAIDRFLQDKGKGRGGDGGNYRRNAGRELDRFRAWARGDIDRPSDRRGEWTGIVDEDRDPTFEEIDASVFREYARYLAGDRGLKQNTVQTYYAYLSGWCRWCVNEGYLESHYAQQAKATAPLPDDDGRKPGDQQAWTAEQRHQLTAHVDQQVLDAYEDLPPEDERMDGEDQQAVRYEVLKAMRDRALVYVLAYTAVRAGEVLRDPNDPRRRGLRWEDVDIDDQRMDVYRKKQSWDSAGIPEPVVEPLETYRERLDPPSDRWPVFPTFSHATAADQVTEALADRGRKPDAIEQRRDQYHRDFLLALDEDVHLPSISPDAARSILQRLCDAAEIDVPDKHGYLAPHGGRRGMGEVLVRAFGYTAAARYLDNSEEMVRQRYSHIEAGELGDIATEALDSIDGQ